MGSLGSAARALHVLLLALWTGGALQLWLLRRTSRTRMSSLHEAERLVIELVSSFEGWAALGAPLLAVTLVLGWLPLQTPLRRRFLVWLALSASALLSRRWMAPQIVELLDGLGAPWEAAAGSASAQELANWVDASSWNLLAQVFLSALLVVGAMTASRPRPRHGIEL